MISSCSRVVFRSELSRASYCRWTIPRHCRLGRCECVARLSRTVCADPNDGNPWRDTNRNRRNRVAGNDYPGSAAKSVLAVAGVTIAHGSDNIAIYVPTLATQTTVGMFTTVAVFFLMTGVWLVLARWFVRHPAWGQVVQSYGHRIVPWALILLGASIVYEAVTIGWLVRDPRRPCENLA